MLLYHGSNTLVMEPDLTRSSKYLDFGVGFYLTESKKQAAMFSRKVVLREVKKKKDPGVATISVYEFDDAFDNELKTLIFGETSGEWLKYITNNRLGLSQYDDYDVVIGPVANDDVYKVLRLLNSGVYTEEHTLKELKVRKLFIQYTLKTEKALRCLRFVEAIRVKEDDL